MITGKEITRSILHLIYPHVCAGCGTDLVSDENLLCFHCHAALPETNFQFHIDNPVEKIFWGRIQLESATAQYYFTKDSLIQKLMHLFKYRGNRDLGIYLGRLMGENLKRCGRFDAAALIPIPLFQKKKKQRGYNQAEVLCDGISEMLKIPVLKNVLIRPEETQSQTKKGREDRWKNIEGKFKLIKEDAIRHKHLILVDDVITTGATLEACGRELLQSEEVKLSVATLCYTER